MKTILKAAYKKYKAGKEFYRARIWDKGKGFDKSEMGAPPAEEATAGHANTDGISFLYLADSVDTTLHEIRADVYDSATVAKFRSNKDIKVVNLAAIDKISPF